MNTPEVAGIVLLVTMFTLRGWPRIIEKVTRRVAALVTAIIR